MGITDYNCPEEIWETPLMRRLSKIERSEDPGFVLDTAHWRMYWLPGRCDDSHDIRRGEQIIAIRNGQKDGDKTVLTYHHGLFHVPRMTFYVEKRLRDVSTSDGRITYESKVADYVYLDDTVIISRTPNKHLQLVQQFLTLLHYAGVILNLKKCAFSRTTLIFSVMSFALRSSKSRNPRLMPCTDFKTPQIWQNPGFLGLCNVFRRNLVFLVAHWTRNFVKIKNCRTLMD